MADDVQFEIDDAERRHLQDMVRHPGYRVLRQIWKAYIDQSTTGAITLSKNDPLANADAIAQAWAYVAIAQKVQTSLEAGVKFELDMLKASAAEKSDPELIARRRLHIILGELDQPPTE